MSDGQSLVQRLRKECPYDHLYENGCPVCAERQEAADRIQALEVALRLGIDMPGKQARYFRGRSKENLVISKQAETAFDDAARRALEADP
jgi:hypothetical protein